MDEELTNLMLKFLQRHFPITKIKKDGTKRFKRGIFVGGDFTAKEDRKYYISDGNDLKLLYGELFNILQNVFGSGPSIINPVLFHHLNLD